MNVIEHIKKLAKDGGCSRIFVHISESGYGEIRTDPSSLKGKAGWPLAWQIAEDVGISWGCGNPGQHQVLVETAQLDEALPSAYQEAREAEARTVEALNLAQENLEAREREIIEAWRKTPEGVRYLEKRNKSISVATEAGEIKEALRPLWLGGMWITVGSDDT